MPFVKRSNTHQTHWEDLVLLGPDGLDELDDKIEGTLEKIQDSNSDRMNITTKIDGSPALFCWSSYPGLPDNSVSLKSFVKDTAADNCISTPEQVDQKYGDRPTMAQMLKYGLELAKSIPAGECWQGDCLFTKDSKREEEINGKDYITFQPNKIIYAFSEGQPGYEQVKNADFGICFHTIYVGENKAQTFKVDPTRLKNVPSNFYIMSPVLNVKGSEKFNFDKIKIHIDRLNRLENQLVSNDGYATLVSNAKFMKDYWSTFENKVLADNKQVTINENTFIKELKDYIDEKMGKDIDKLKSEKGKAGARKKLEDLQALVDSNRQVLTLLVKTLNEAALIKMLLWEGFKQSKSDYDTFYKSKTKGYFDADMEGVAVSDQDGNIVKIVDRSAFSSYNRDPDIESGWEHESLSEACLRREFNRLTEDETPVDPSKVLVFSFGKFNPPTIGHVKLAQAMADCDESSNKPVIYLSHKYGVDKKNPLKSQPLDYKEKVYWCKKAFVNLVDVVESNAQTAWEALHEINETRPEIERIVFAGGDDRADGSMFANLANSNGKQTSKPSGDFSFVGGLVPLNAGARDEGSLDLAETASSSLVRRMALENDFEKFKQLVPFDENDADELFDEIRDFYKDSGIINEELNEADEKVFDSDIKNINKSKWNSAKSIRDIYDLLISEIGRDIDSDTRNLLDNTIKDIENLTNSLNISTITALSKKLNASSAGLSANEFIKLFKPSQEDLDTLLKDGGREFGNLNLGNLGFGKASNFLNELIKYKGGSKDSTTNTGPYEFALALIFKNGTMKTGGAGDIKVDNYQVEVKSVSSDAVIGNESETNDMIRAFDDFVFINFDKEQKNKTRSARNSKSFNTVIQGEDIQKIPNIIRQNLNIRDTDTITYEKLFNDVFRYVINIYSKRFNYLAICKGYDVEMIPSNRVADELLGNSKYYITLADYVSGRFFKIRKRK